MTAVPSASHNILESLYRHSGVGLPKTQSLKHMHADPVCVGTDTLLPGAVHDHTQFLERQPNRALFRRLLKPGDDLSGLQPSAVQTDQISLARRRIAARASKRKKPVLLRNRRQKNPSLRFRTDRAEKTVVWKHIHIESDDGTV